MKVDNKLRVMWLLNHTTARKFEIPMLRRMGVEEIFTPKKYPNDPIFRSATVDFSEDASLSIPAADLDKLNAVDWYEGTTRDDWELASRYFDICFLIVQSISPIKFACQHFKGVVVWRTFGLSRPTTYSSVLDLLSAQFGAAWIRHLGPRFFFGQAYPHLADVEKSYLASRALHLPLGMQSICIKDEWCGNEESIFFVCPGLHFNQYYNNIYRQFKIDFGNYPHKISGAQLIDSDDPNVLGFITDDVYQRNMRELRLMWYHSDEPYHLHYHPLEAVRAGMPLLFKSNGMLDQLGGGGLPGRCATIAEAQRKAKRILAGDRVLIDEIRRSQHVLLKQFDPENCVSAWQAGMKQLLASIEKRYIPPVIRPPKRQRIAVILPVSYKGGTLRGAKVLAEAIRLGSAKAGASVQIVLAYPESGKYTDRDFEGLHSDIRCRPMTVKTLSSAEARRAMAYAGFGEWRGHHTSYTAFDDGINSLYDCDLWLVVSDRLEHPVLPLRPAVHMVYDYIQRYIDFLPPVSNKAFIEAARAANRVLVTTEFTRRDALQYAGIRPEHVIKVPMLPPLGMKPSRKPGFSEPSYFLWTTNRAKHKNQAKALAALGIYYGEMDGQLDCMVSGVETRRLFQEPPSHLQQPIDQFQLDRELVRRIKWLGYISEQRYIDLLAGAAFLWHPALVDNGTFSVIEAALVGVPSLSSHYPAMQEISKQFELPMEWMDSDDEHAMAQALKAMETNSRKLRRSLPTAKALARHDVENLCVEYWKAVRECL